MDTKYRILVVDDSETIRDATVEILAHEGYSMMTASGANEALSLLSQGRFDLFLLDVMMPEVNGLTLLKDLKVYENTYEAVMMTGHENIDDAATAMELGAFSYIRKPIKREELIHHVQKALAMVSVKKNRYDHLMALEEKIRSRTTELENAVRQLEQQGMRIDAIINSMGEGLLATDNNGTVVLMNGVAETITGLRFSDCAGVHVARLDARREVKDFLRSHAGEMMPAMIETKVLSVALDNADTRHYSVNMQAITDEAGDRTGTVMLFMDQTGAVHMEALRNSFLSVAAHELRTPVNIIMNYLSLLKTKGDSGDIRAVAVEDMSCANNRIKYLVNSIISFVNLSAGYIPVYAGTVDAGAIVREEIEKLGGEMREKNVGFEVAPANGASLISADPHLVRVALSNVLSNAVKFNRQNGKVRIAVKDAAVKGAPGISIDVSDDGEGISERAMNNLFEGFIQGEDPNTRSHSGLGTGLYLAKRAVELLGGEIRADSHQGQGSRFSIELPVCPVGCTLLEKGPILHRT